MTLVGTIIGAGLFAVPGVYLRLGLGRGVALTIFLGVMLTFVSLMVAEAILRTVGAMRLPGMVRLYLHPYLGTLQAVSAVVGFWGALLAYLLLGGTFLSVIFSRFIPLPLWAWQLGFYALCAIVVIAGIGLVGKMEVWVTGALIAVFLFFVARLLPHVAVANFSFDLRTHIFSQYGILLFALYGSSAVANVRDLLRGQESRVAPTIVFGGFFATLLTTVFGVAVFAVSGQATTDDAISGLIPFLGDSVVTLGAVLGLLAVSTSFFSAGLYLKDIFRLDYHLSLARSAIAALGMPIVLFFLGFKQFLPVLGFVGSLFGITDTILICRAYAVARKKGGRKPEFFLQIPGWGVAFFLVLFVSLSACAVLSRMATR
jgi:amino acid permease